MNTVRQTADGFVSGLRAEIFSALFLGSHAEFLKRSRYDFKVGMSKPACRIQKYLLICN